MHVLCVTPNVSIDRTLVVPGFAVGGVWRAACVDAVCGGKGVNVARALIALGHRATCAGMLGGHTGRLAAELATAEGLRTAWTWTLGETRTCFIIVGGAATVINEPGSRISAVHWEGFARDVAMAARGVDAVCIGGSMPPGAPDGAFRALIEHAGRDGRPVWVDTSGTALAEAAGAAMGGGSETAIPVGIKVNAEEASVLVGQPVVSAESAMVAAQSIRRRGVVSRVVITLGAAGAVLVNDDASLWARPPSVAEVNAVGCGDCFLAGLVAGWHEHGSPEEALRLATAAGAANALRTTVGVSAADVASLFAKTTLTPLH